MTDLSLPSEPNQTRIADPYLGLPDIDQVAPVGDDDRRCLEALREVLVRHNALDRFGISLLHTHFPIYADELLIEDCDPVARTMTLRPIKKTDMQAQSGQIVETSWRLNTGAVLTSCQTNCFRMAPDPNGNVQHRSVHARGG